ncbi:hypothetical protein [Pseudomonas sp. GV071]|jgi:hypothetical protein|uniref:hypothetical protein n=1 Tax=Pseudomonas sp. GV071 TaxID=2135754 RepID=UPI000D4238C7|nr:hypothetical protein [Pseudomonas sp. GV071]PTQ66876.1 hypothetical protein C8K61_11814 [Pseudomonas sp. GV071]
MMRYRTLLLGLIGLFLAGCAGYDYDDNYDRSYGRGGYGNVYSAPVYGGGYSVQQYRVYSAPRYYSPPPVYRPAPRYYVPAPQPRYYSTPHRAPMQQGWNQPPRGYYPAPGRGQDRHHSRGRDDHRGNDHRGDDRGRGDGRQHRR